jgi:hypothetical protein
MICCPLTRGARSPLVRVDYKRCSVVSPPRGPDFVAVHIEYAAAWRIHRRVTEDGIFLRLDLIWHQQIAVSCWNSCEERNASKAQDCG